MYIFMLSLFTENNSLILEMSPEHRRHYISFTQREIFRTLKMLTREDYIII